MRRAIGSLGLSPFLVGLGNDTEGGVEGVDAGTDEGGGGAGYGVPAGGLDDYGI